MSPSKNEEMKIRVPGSLKAEFKRIADSRFTSESAIAREAMLEYLQARGIVLADTLQEASTPYNVVSSPQPAPKRDTANKVLGLVKESYPQPAKKKRAAHPKAPK